MAKHGWAMIFVLLQLFSGLLRAQESEVTGKIVMLSEKINQSFSAGTDSGARRRIAVTNFSNVGPVAEKKNIGYLVSEVLSGELAKSGNFILVERMHLEKVLAEQALALSGLIDSKTSVQIGTMLGAQAIISGSVIEAGGVFIVNARMVEVEGGKVILTESVEIPQADLIALSNKLIVTKKYALDAVYRSLLLPGWGQFYNDTPGRGYFYLGACVISLGSALFFKIAGDGDYEEYQKNTPESVQYFDLAADKYTIRDYAVYAAVGIWLINVADAQITARGQLRQDENRSARSGDIQLGVAPAASGPRLELVRVF